MKHENILQNKLEQDGIPHVIEKQLQIKRVVGYLDIIDPELFMNSLESFIRKDSLLVFKEAKRKNKLSANLITNQQENKHHSNNCLLLRLAILSRSVKSINKLLFFSTALYGYSTNLAPTNFLIGIT